MRSSRGPGPRVLRALPGDVTGVAAGAPALLTAVRRRAAAALAAASLAAPFPLPAPAAFLASAAFLGSAALLAPVAATAQGATPRATGTFTVPAVVRDDRGLAHRFEQPPRRIVSLLPSLTESVCALGACERLVGVDRHSNWPASIAALPRLGGLEDARIEAIVALRPDLVLASTSTRAVDRLRALGLPVVALDSDTHADVRRSLALLAPLLGTEADGERAWAQIERRLDLAAAHLPATLRGARVYFEVGGGPHAAGASSFIGQTLARLGLDNVAPAGLGPFPALNPEFVVRANPDVVIGVATEAAALARRPGWREIAALRPAAGAGPLGARQCALPSAHYETVIRPGPRLGEAAWILADCLARLPGAAAVLQSTASGR